MNEWIEKDGFYVIKRKVKSSEGFESFMPLMTKEDENLHALLIWKTQERAEVSLKNYAEKDDSYRIEKETLDYYNNLQDDFKKFRINIALKIVEQLVK